MPKPQPTMQMRATPGYVTFCEFDPAWPEAMSPGGIALTTGHVTGANDNSKSTWGRVYVSGAEANRATCEPFGPEIQQREGFPLPHGTWIVGRKANYWTLAQDIKAFQTHDVVAHFPASMKWADVVAELQRARKCFPEVE